MKMPSNYSWNGASLIIAFLYSLCVCPVYISDDASYTFSEQSQSLTLQHKLALPSYLYEDMRLEFAQGHIVLFMA